MYLSISEKDLPELSKWKVGNGYRMTIDTSMKEMRVSEDMEGNKVLHGEFKVSKITSTKKIKDPFEMSKKEFREATERGLSGEELY